MLFFCMCRGSEAFGNSCAKTMEPEDVTMGIIVGKSYCNMVICMYVWL